MIYKLISYLFPITIYKTASDVSKSIEVVLYNGKLMIDTPNTNYSYGSLQRILRFGLQKIGFQKIRNMQHILVLGMAGGSVIKTLTDEVKYTHPITAVDIDKNIVDVAVKFFKMNEIDNLEIIIEDAQKFVKQTDKTYHLIIIDIFQDSLMPDFLFSEVFINQVIKILKPDGIVLFNTMKNNEIDTQRNLKFATNCNQNFNIEILPNVEGNELFLISKK
ncbi:MAG: fused MFS/spermidine synthase [Capnocytophaga sp.]|nr:fused MFS/spermidine synthase [Capnocytophaga sp.]